MKKNLEEIEELFLQFNMSRIVFAEEEEEEEEEARIVVSLIDITELRNAEENLKNAYNELENTQQELIQSQTLAALGEFSAGLAHEIRNPLANISALAQFSIKNYTIDKPIKQNLKSIMKSSEKANRIIKELLDFARPRELILKPGYIIDSINRACELTKAKRSNNQIRLYKRCSRRLPKIMIDEQRMQQVFLNIINNSIDAMNKGGRLSITAYLEDEFIVVNISDTGKGIQKHNIDKIFNPFFTLKHEGIGLGLSVTHRIIQSHKGKIEVESEYNKGTKFIIRLPIINDN
ncbi:MAG: ATP-binding protein [Candidatus Cloacimonadales bacterium]|nr:ATP-binding protein [Candidatus Cloacimonadales bacterium]